MKITETSEALQKLFYQYTHLPLGGKEIVCPYWMNKIKQKVFGPSGGKGNPQQITEITIREAQSACFDLVKASEEEVIAFMRTRKIGVDCSGFIFWMLDALDKEKGGNGIVDDIPEANGSFVASKASVRLLTNSQTASRVNLENVCVGDIIRHRGGKHAMIVVSLERDDEGGLWKIIYAHSSDRTEIGGVHLGIINIVYPQKTLSDQLWQEKTATGESYLVEFLPETGDGLFRLLLFNQERNNRRI